MKDIKYTNVDAGTGEITVDPAFSFEVGESISVGDTVVAGSYTTTHSELDDLVERYLISYCVFQILKRDSSSDVQVQQVVLQAMEKEIIDSYKELSDDIVEIPNIISYEDEW